MKFIVLGVVLFTSALWADEVADRAAVGRTILALNSTPVGDVFASDFDSKAELQRLFFVPVTPTVSISKEPWGEATITLTPIRSTIMTRKIRFITPDVAIVDVEGSGPAVIILRKEGSAWKIASLRILAEPTVVASR